MGIAAGTALASEGDVEAAAFYPSDQYVRHGCHGQEACGGCQGNGGCGGCRSYGRCMGMQAYGYAPSQNSNTYYQTQGSCTNYTQPQYPSVQPATAYGATPVPTTEGATISRWETSGYTADASKSPTINRTLTESDLISQLNEQGKASYQRLDPAGKALALKLANQECANKNECRGLNSCRTGEHSCAGKGSCKNTAPVNFKDKNLAVKVAELRTMAEKRSGAALPR